MRLAKILLEAQGDAAKMEEVICDLWNGKESPYPKMTDDGVLAVKYLKSLGIKGNAVHMGSGNGTLTSNWKKWGGTDGTPKTDLMIGKYKISLKKTGGSQLMSAKKGEATATCYAAIDKLNMKSDPIVSELERYLDKFIEGNAELNVTAQKKAGVAPKEVLNADVMHKEFTKYLKKYFESNNDFKNAIVHEAMTGNYKFGNDKARATHIFVYDPAGTKFEWSNTDDPSFIAKKSSKANVSISWKSASSENKNKGKFYNYYSSFRLTEDIQNKIDEEVSKYKGEYLTEGILSKITDKVKSWFKNVWNKIKEWLLKGMENVLKFFNLEPDAKLSEVYF